MMTVQRYSETFSWTISSTMSTEAQWSAAFWSPILGWRQQTVKRSGGGWVEVMEFELRRQNGMFCQWSSGHWVHFELNMSCSGGADRDLQTGCRSRQREEASNVRCRVGLYAPWLTMTGAEAPLPPGLDRSPLFHRLLKKLSCVRGHPAHADWRG